MTLRRDDAHMYREHASVDSMKNLYSSVLHLVRAAELEMKERCKRVEVGDRQN
jgi:hypothetical protein